MLAEFPLRDVVQHTLLHVPESTAFRELFTKEVASKLASEGCLEESLTMSVSPTGKGEWKTVCCEDNISLSVLFGCRYINFHLFSLVEEPPLKRLFPDRRCAFKTLLQNAAKRDCLISTRPVITSRNSLFNNVIAHFEVVWTLKKLYSYCSNYL